MPVRSQFRPDLWLPPARPSRVGRGQPTPQGWTISPWVSEKCELYLYVVHYVGMSDWLSTLGYDLDSLIPKISFDGHIRPEPPIHLDNHVTAVTSAYQCAYEQISQNLVSFSAVPLSLLSGHRGKPSTTFKPLDLIFGAGVVVAHAEDGKVSVRVLESSQNPTLARLAVVLLGDSFAVDGPSLTTNGRKTGYFTRPESSDALDDLNNLSISFTNGYSAMIQNSLNVSVRWTPETKHFVDVRLFNDHTLICVRYGTTRDAERARLISLAEERAFERAWSSERELVRTKKRTANAWTEQQKEELLRDGCVSGVGTRLLRSLLDFPEIGDDPANVLFVPSER